MVCLEPSGPACTLADISQVCGLSSVEQAQTDVRDAKNLGVDAFALNVQNVVDSWATGAIEYLFTAAAQNDFHLFFSFDMAVLNEQDPTSFLPIFEQYASNDTYYKHDGKPFISTFNGGIMQNGGEWTRKFREAIEADNITPYFVSDFGLYSSSSASASESIMGSLSTYSAVDGVFSWETAWPSQNDGLASILSSVTDKVGSDAAHATGKSYLMPLSSHQFKHIDGLGNWYRRGELTLPNRMKQILELSPEFVMLLTWNDAGESHYIGNVWQESISTSEATKKYVDDFDHSAWQDVISPFISAYKNDAKDETEILPLNNGNFTGAMWYRPLLKDASCSGDYLGKPIGWENAQDTVNFAIVLPAETSGVKINVYSGDTLLKSFDGKAGMNAQAVQGMRAGAQKVEVVGADGNVIGAGLSKVDVAADADFCNFNYHVVHVA
ncbi:glycoside hydrolase [Macrophomina phaseolina]|uniref:Glycoside hydrolase n=1 Tax=Macrophomina phaseolina TaxID=35725 RepID=A0ABQ8FXG8_9PEZI|nr:glycoside hydrolase [Macrophomina phaseolina]